VGAGRPKVIDKPVKAAFWVDREVLDRAHEAARAKGTTVSQVPRGASADPRRKGVMFEDGERPRGWACPPSAAPTGVPAVSPGSCSGTRAARAADVCAQALRQSHNAFGTMLRLSVAFLPSALLPGRAGPLRAARRTVARMVCAPSPQNWKHIRDGLGAPTAREQSA